MNHERRRAPRGRGPRLSNLSWGLLGLFLATDLLTELRRASPLVQDLSPFAHVPRLLLGHGGDGLPGLALAAALLLAGLFGWRRRDLGAG